MPDAPSESPPAPPLAARTNGRTEFRRDAYPLRLTLPPLRAADGHAVGVTITVMLTLPDTPADHELFVDAFLTGRPAATADDVRQKLLPALAASVGEFVARHDAAACLRQQAAIETLLVRRCDAVGYGCGLKFGPATHLDITSDTLQLEQARADLSARQLAELDRVGRLHEKLRSIGEAYRLPAADQASLLPSLLQADTQNAGLILATAGPNVIAIEQGTVRVAAVVDGIGALRKIVRLSDAAGRRWAVGGQRGVVVLDEAFAVTHVLTAPTTSARGFNGLAAMGGSVVASHAELGLVTWDPGRPAEPRVTGRTAPPRHLAVFDDATVHTDALADAAGDPMPARAVALLDVGPGLVQVNEDGGVYAIEGRDGRARLRFKAAPCDAAAVLRAGGLRALVLAGDGGVECWTADGERLGHIDPKPAGLRMVGVAAGRIVGASTDRATVHAWDWTTPRTPAWSVNVLARTGHHVTDLLAAFE